ncbi:unnamed protein product [Paramecium sonneborni]|uniref:Uncharacterized protein n=1 Tax=Paramecium sonneborni TaxID=65129 RepID=A0A8S1RI94_9CILI|nr:unnamed protein product [Paramecium sonneborni]
MDHYQIWVILNIIGASALILLLLYSLIDIAIDQGQLKYGSLKITFLAWVIITVGMIVGSDTAQFKEASLDYNIPVSNWFAITGICFQIAFNGFENAIQDDPDNKEVDSDKKEVDLDKKEVDLDKKEVDLDNQQVDLDNK